MADPSTVRSSTFTFLPYGSDNYFSSDKKLAGWIEHSAAQMGVSQGQFILSHLEQAREGDRSSKKFVRFAGVIRNGARDLSTRKGFSKK